MVKKNWRFKLREARQRFRLTPTEKRVAMFVAAAFTLGLITKCYRDAHPSPTPAALNIKPANSIRTAKAKRAPSKPTEDGDDQ